MKQWVRVVMTVCCAVVLMAGAAMADPAAVRSSLAGKSISSGDDAITALADAVKTLENAGGIKWVATDSVIDAMAKDLCHKAHKATTACTTCKTDAKDQFTSNKCRGFTDHTDTVYMVEKIAAKSDGIHELVHICSGPGGICAIQTANNALNEGVTQYFTMKVCEKRKEACAAAYPEWVEFVTKLAATIGNDALFKWYVKGDAKDAMKKMAETYLGYLKTGTLSDGKTKTVYSEKQVKTEQDAEKLILEQIAKGDDANARKWLTLRVTKP